MPQQLRRRGRARVAGRYPCGQAARLGKRGKTGDEPSARFGFFSLPLQSFGRTGTHSIFTSASRTIGYVKKGFYLEIVRWENFLDAMSETRLQDEYNKQVRACDIFVSLFFTKTGKFTEEEFDTAHRQFKETGSPRIYTFFKNADVAYGQYH